MAEMAGRISEPTFKGITATLFGAAILMAIIRTTIRIRTQRRILPDDLVLLSACVTLIAATGILYSFVPALYMVEEHSLHPDPALLGAKIPPNISNKILRYKRLETTHAVLLWTTIYLVKFCFLLFFLQLVSRVKRLFLAWKIAFGITALFYCFSIGSVILSCPHFDASFAKKCQQGSGFTRRLAFNITQTVLDIVTDLLVISIPVFLLWKVKIKLGQKILLGIFLCLSMTMIMIAIVRISVTEVGSNAIDTQWSTFWQNVEADAAVITVSITAFRSMLGVKASKVREKKDRSWYSYRRRFLSRKAKSQETELDMDQLPSIPGASMTGMRTFIRGHRNSNLMASEFGGDDDTTRSKDDSSRAQHYIKVTHKISSESEAVSKEASIASVNLV